MTKQEFYIESSDGKNRLHCIKWEPEGEVKCVLQVIHGMKEYIDRYDELANFLTGKGIAVIGCDHLGHGLTASCEEDLGIFAENGGKKFLLLDQYAITRYAKKTYEGKKIFVLGHSMGSFILRRYLTMWGGKIDGALIMGTGSHTLAESSIGLFLSYVIMHLKGTRYKSKLLYMISDGYYSFWYKIKRKGSWLNRNGACVKQYCDDPLCGFKFTASAYHTLFSILNDLALHKNNKRIPKDLPVLFLSGMCDMVGNNTKGVLNAYNEMIANGLEDVDVAFYEGARHEILMEDCKDEVMDDIFRFIEEHN